MCVIEIQKDVKIEIEEPPKLFSENKSAINISHQALGHDRLKDLTIDCHFFEEAWQQSGQSVQCISRTKS